MIHMLVGREHHLRVADCARRDWHREAPPVPAIARHLARQVGVDIHNHIATLDDKTSLAQRP